MYIWYYPTNLVRWQFRFAWRLWHEFARLWHNSHSSAKNWMSATELWFDHQNQMCTVISRWDTPTWCWDLCFKVFQTDSPYEFIFHIIMHRCSWFSNAPLDFPKNQVWDLAPRPVRPVIWWIPSVPAVSAIPWIPVVALMRSIPAVFLLSLGSEITRPWLQMDLRARNI